jgi:uncharacterized membrane protein YgcG
MIAQAFGALLLGLTVATSGGTGRAAEQVAAFEVTIDVRRDGALEVVETITVDVEGRVFKRGLIRDFPLRRAGAERGVTFDVMSVRRNGVKEPYAVNREGGYAHVRIGSAEVFLPAPSRQTYEIRYRTEGQIGFFDDFDELYWNVTGSEWSVPIASALVEITTPGLTPIMQRAGYTGPPRAQGRAFVWEETGEGVVRARTTAPLPPGEGFTVAVGWAKGMVVPIAQRAPGLSPEIAALSATALGTLALVAAWLSFGRDPPPGVIYPRFEPPDGISPAAMRYVTEMSFDGRCMTAATVNMAVKGALRIHEEPKTWVFGSKLYTLEPVGTENRDIAPEERAAYAALFASGGQVRLVDGAGVREAHLALREALDKRWGATFRANSLLGLVALALGPVAAIALFEQAGGGRMVGLWLVPALLVGGMTHIVANNVDSAGKLRSGYRRRIVWIVLAALGLGIFVVSRANPEVRMIAAGPLPSLAGAAFGVVAALLWRVMKAPTAEGRRLRDEIDGFRLYLAAAEADRLEVLNPPERTPELFERLLPYAIALGVTHAWGAQFAAALAGAWAPAWLSGSDSGSFDSDSFDSGLDYDMASGGGSSGTSGWDFGSGSDGGGGSGGGGGGGGGSGW